MKRNEKSLPVKLRFAKTAADGFQKELQARVEHLAAAGGIARARRLLWIKLGFYTALFSTAYVALLLLPHPTLLNLCLHYTAVGLSGILLAFNAAHDAVHGAFSRNTKVNNAIYSLTFNLQGVNAYLWRIRHLASHHVFPNVDGCDADIDDNPFIRLSPSQARRWHHRMQHWYALPLYAVYTLHWILIKDFLYLRKRELANLRDLVHPPRAVAELLGWKIVYFGYLVGAPLAIGLPAGQVLTAFLVMHAVISIFFVLTLIISHLCEETEFPLPDAAGRLPYDFHRHQLAVSLDYHPASRLANWIFGGFNSHAAHHLFQHHPHTLYPDISVAIRETCRKYDWPYHALPIPQAIASHFRYLRKMAR